MARIVCKTRTDQKIWKGEKVIIKMLNALQPNQWEYAFNNNLPLMMMKTVYSWN
jgi:predicted DCC family thiol-disulfide oxidoreductase YuxK